VPEGTEEVGEFPRGSLTGLLSRKEKEEIRANVQARNRGVWLAEVSSVGRATPWPDNLP
jgi:hypothetical protein